MRIRFQRGRRTDRQLLIVFMRRLQSLKLRRMRTLMQRPLRIGTRGSQLALWQSRWVQNALAGHWPKTSFELTVIKTTGDKIQDVPLSQVGGKGLFVKEIEEALLAGRIDLAVHSMKDMPSELPPGLTIGAIPPRENPLDILAAGPCTSLAALPQGARVGTSSLRRTAQVRHMRPDVQIIPLRGNLDTRLRKLAAGDMDAVILAAAGLLRLGLSDRISAYLPPDQMLPAVGQGALCIETRRDDPVVGPLMAALEHADTRTAVTAERAFLARLEGGCQVPIAAHARIDGEQIHLTGLVAETDGRRILKSAKTGARNDAQSMGRQLAEELLAQGAGDILERVRYDA
jgi:hydroxymethylbilane synthase